MNFRAPPAKQIIMIINVYKTNWILKLNGNKRRNKQDPKFTSLHELLMKFLRCYNGSITRERN